MESATPGDLVARAFQHAPLAMLLQTPTGEVLESNRLARIGMRVDGDALHGLGPDDPIWVVLDEHGERLGADEYPGVVAGRTGRPVYGRTVGFTSGAELRWLNVDAVPLRDAEGAVEAVAVYLRDVTEQIRAERAASQVEARLERARTVGGVGLWEWDPTMRRLTVDDRFVAVLGGHRPTDLTGWLALVHPEDRSRMEAELRGTAPAAAPSARPGAVADPSGGPADDSGEPLRITGADGRPRWFRLSCDAPASPDGAIAGIVVDTTELCLANERLAEAATTDALTGLRNRASLLEWLGARLTSDDEHPTVLFVDLDRFKLVNDIHGHAEGDRLLCEVARRLSSLVRDTDAVARLGGDEFIVAVCSDAPEGAHSLAARILEELRRPIDVGGRRVVASASVGVAFAGPGADAETLLRDADAAMYQAKGGGRNRSETYDDSSRRAAVRRLEVETDLQGAAARGELRAAYQAMFDARTGDAVGAEALCRWRHPRRGLVGAGGFIPVAEESGLIVEIGQAMLDTAVSDLPALTDALGTNQARIWVNVSSRQLDEPDFAPRLIDQLGAAGLVGRIGIEVTETGLVRDEHTSALALVELAESGVPIAIDDFGTGYSSMARLVDFPVDMLKIDQSFVRGLFTRDTSAVISAMVEVAHAIGAQTCAEGIETVEQLDAVLALGVDLLSGFHLGRPVPAEALRASLVQPRVEVAEAIGRLRSPARA